jgi:hypothetical protein
MLKLIKTAAAAALLCVGGQAMAAGVNFDTPPPASVIVLEAGLEWIWAAPCAPQSPSCGAPGNPAGTYPIQGFRIPTLAEWAAAWSDRNELIAAFTLPTGGARCGTPWMNGIYNHCDYGDLTIGFIHGAAVNGICDPNNQFGDGCTNGLAESFLVRQANPVSAPTSLLLAGLALGLAGWMRRKA